MPHFSPTGHDTYLCQLCAREIDSGVDRGAWRTDLTGSKSAGMCCTPCIRKAEKARGGQHTSPPVRDAYVAPTRKAQDNKGPISLYEHTRRESGLTGFELDRYVNRYYGHG